MDLTQVPHFKGYRVPGVSDFEAAKSQIQTGFGQLDINLNAASSAFPGNSNGWVILPIAGDFLYVDTDPLASNGVASLQFNVQQDAGGAKFYAQPGQVWLTTFKQIALSWQAQLGRSMRLIYATGDRLLSTQATIANAAVAPGNVTDQGIVYGAAYHTNAAMTINTPDNIWAAASNVNGAAVWQAEGLSGNAASISLLAILCKATAPTSTSDGVVIAQGTGMMNLAASFHNFVRLARAVNVPAGLRGDWISTATETLGVQRTTLYTLR